MQTSDATQPCGGSSPSPHRPLPGPSGAHSHLRTSPLGQPTHDRRRPSQAPVGLTGIQTPGHSFIPKDAEGTHTHLPWVKSGAEGTCRARLRGPRLGRLHGPMPGLRVVTSYTHRERPGRALSTSEAPGPSGERFVESPPDTVRGVVGGTSIFQVGRLRHEMTCLSLAASEWPGWWGVAGAGHGWGPCRPLQPLTAALSPAAVPRLRRARPAAGLLHAPRRPRVLQRLRDRAEHVGLADG